MTRAKKELMVQQLRQEIESPQNIILADYQGLPVAEINDLRNKLRQEGVKFRVVKNSLFRRALQESPLDGLLEYVSGPTAAALGQCDPVVLAKLLMAFSQEHSNLKIKAGVLEGRLFKLEELQEVAKLPPKPELLARLIGSIAGPLQGLALSLQGPLSHLILTLQAIADKST